MGERSAPWFDLPTGSTGDLPSDCEREPVNSDLTGIGFSRSEMDYIDQQITGAIQGALERINIRHSQDLATLSMAITETKTSNIDTIRNLALQIAVNCHCQSDAPIRSKEIVESAREFHSFLKGYEG